MSPNGARTIAVVFVLLTGGVVANVAFMQDGANTRRAMRHKVDGATRKAEIERMRRLAEREPRLQLASLTMEAPLQRSASVAGLASPSEPVSPPENPATQRPAGVDRLSSWGGQAQAVQAAIRQRAAVRTAMIKEIQVELGKRGYGPGPADGGAGLVTKAAILAFEHDQGLPETGEPNALVHQWLTNPKRAAQAGSVAPATAGRLRTTSPVARTIRQMLAAQGYFPAKSDGDLPTALTDAIMRFEMERGLVPSGRISGPLAAALSKSRTTRIGAVVAPD